MRYISTFSGVEAATLAWEPLGWQPVAFSEIEPFPCAVLAHRYPNVPNLGDITKIDWRGLRGSADLVVGGSPCQSFSVAGDRTGLSGASGLMWEYVRAVRELMPRWCVWENVPGALSSSRGEDFGCLLRALDGLGYGLAWRVLDAQFFGVAQRRRRVYLVGRLGAEPPAEVLVEPDGLRWNPKSSREKRKELAAGAGGGPDCTGECLALRMREGRDGGGKGPLVQEGVSGTLATKNDQAIVAFSYKASSTAGSPAICEDGVSPTVTEDWHAPAVGGVGLVRRLTPLECERLMGFPDGWTQVPYRGKPAEECPDGPRYKAIGNSMCVNVMRWIGQRIQMSESGEIW